MFKMLIYKGLMILCEVKQSGKEERSGTRKRKINIKKYVAH